MTKEELHNAAEEWLDERHPTQRPYDEIWKLGLAEELAAFHLHQSKKMLEGWTDERINILANERYPDVPHLGYYTQQQRQNYLNLYRGGIDFRDELLKRL